jgi:hypothetical protein
MLLLEEKNKMLHLIKLKAYLQVFMFGKEKVHGDVTILCSSSLPSSDISMYRCGFCFCIDLSMLLNFWIWSCMLNGVIGRPSLQCCHHHLLFLVLIISLLSLFHRFPLCPEQNIYQNKYSSIEKFMKLPFQRVVIHRKRSSNKGAMPILLQRCVLSKTDFRTCCTRCFSHNCL